MKSHVPTVGAKGSGEGGGIDRMGVQQAGLVFPFIPQAPPGANLVAMAAVVEVQYHLGFPETQAGSDVRSLASIFEHPVGTKH